MPAPATARQPPAAPPALRVLRARPVAAAAVSEFPPIEPDGAFAAESAGGVRLHVRAFEPAAPAGRTLLWVHGAFEHGGRYGHAARFFTARGWRVLVPDLRGHGESGGVPMHARRFDEYAADLRAVLHEAGCDPARTAALGNSMGGLAVIRLLQGAGGTGDEPAPVAAGAVCSPLLRIVTPVPWLTRAAGHAVKLVRPTARFAVPPDADAAVQAERVADPLRHASVTAGWFFAVRRGVREAWRDAGTLVRPAEGGAERARPRRLPRRRRRVGRGGRRRPRLAPRVAGGGARGLPRTGLACPCRRVEWVAGRAGAGARGSGGGVGS